MFRQLRFTLALPLLAPMCACGPVAPDANEAHTNEWQEEVSDDDSSGSEEPRAGSDTATDEAASTNLSAKEQAILDRHNAHRADHCAPPLRWSTDLAQVAQKWADQLKENNCAFDHSDNSPYGENLSFFAPVGSSSPEEVATGWYSEVSEYDFRNPTFGMNTGHFTQVVWRGTTGVGCGQSQCNGGELWVCNYNPPGNMAGSFEQNVRPTGCAGQ